ncbi:hypothetical protein F2P81_006086 [Scophthalmus maximus]|uniref:Uncharacterized protein n=1 Tax=Scophthalmus maximus TaxID=52904 RepID=A0A6A4TH34_SCOMX|nr:hypothetical protein F2P81_006086 [Scophthalmus maximus]
MEKGYRLQLMISRPVRQELSPLQNANMAPCQQRRLLGNIEVVLMISRSISGMPYGERAAQTLYRADKLSKNFALIFREARRPADPETCTGDAHKLQLNIANFGNLARFFIHKTVAISIFSNESEISGLVSPLVCYAVTIQKVPLNRDTSWQSNAFDEEGQKMDDETGKLSRKFGFEINVTRCSCISAVRERERENSNDSTTGKLEINRNKPHGFIGPSLTYAAIGLSAFHLHDSSSYSCKGFGDLGRLHPADGLVKTSFLWQSRVLRCRAMPSDSYTNDLREAAVQRTNVSTASHTPSPLRSEDLLVVGQTLQTPFEDRSETLGSSAAIFGIFSFADPWDEYRTPTSEEEGLKRRPDKSCVQSYGLPGLPGLSVGNTTPKIHLEKKRKKRGDIRCPRNP